VSTKALRDFFAIFYNFYSFFTNCDIECTD
jgi:hypothetical protein